MSRCFPFPRPGCMRDGACSEALIESIKLQRESEKAKKEPKEEKRREKKEKRKERKARKEKEGKATHANDGEVKQSKLNNVESYQLEEIKAEPGIGCLQKDDENEQLERSGITEEHDQPVSSRDYCCLSDSTQSSKKRKRNNSPSSHDNGTVLRIRLPLRKHSEAEKSQPDDQLGSTFESAGTADSFIQETNGCFPQKLMGVFPSNNSSTELCIGLRSLVPESAGAVLVTDSHENQSLRLASVCDSLFQKWVPSPIRFVGIESDDQDWLFRSELQEGRSVSKKLNSVTADTFRCSSATLWPPRAQFLPEAEICALPYSVPF